MNDDDIQGLMDEKFVRGCSDRCRKEMRAREIIQDEFEKYIHTPCDNHKTEKAWEQTQDELEFLEVQEQRVKDCHALFKNSVKRPLELQKISEELEEKFVKSRGIFDIKYLTSEEEAMRAHLIMNN